MRLSNFHLVRKRMRRETTEVMQTTMNFISTGVLWVIPPMLSVIQYKEKHLVAEGIKTHKTGMHLIEIHTHIRMYINIY